MPQKVFLMLLAMILFVACKKENEEPNSEPNSNDSISTTNPTFDTEYNYAYFEGIITDSISGMPIPDLVLETSFDCGHEDSDTTDSNGYYTLSNLWIYAKITCSPHRTAVAIYDNDSLVSNFIVPDSVFVKGDTITIDHSF